MIELPIILSDGVSTRALVNINKVRYIVPEGSGALKCRAITEDDEFYINLSYEMTKKMIRESMSVGSQITRV